MIFTYHMTNIWNTFSRLCLQRLPENKSMSVSEPCVSNGRLGHLANSVVFIWKLRCHWVRRSRPEAVSYQYRNSHYNGEYLHLGCQSDEHLVGCQPDEPLASLVTSEKIINVYGFLVVIMLRMHCLYFIGNEITTTTTTTTGKTLFRLRRGPDRTLDRGCCGYHRSLCCQSITRYVIYLPLNMIKYVCGNITNVYHKCTYWAREGVVLWMSSIFQVNKSTV